MRADKRLGQHFLHDLEVLAQIADVADVGRSAGVLEIGPGEGALTGHLVLSDRPVVALDKDPRAVAAIEDRFGERVQVVHGDAVTADLTALLPPVGEDGRLPVVVGNLPYNVGTVIFRRILDLGTTISRAIVMLQREVARRVVASPGTKDYGVLTVATELYARAWAIRDVPPSAFTPPPKVHSTVLLVEPLTAPRLPELEARAVIRLATRLFQTRRKVLGNAGLDPAHLEQAEIDPRQRPEQLDLETLIRLQRAIANESTT